MATLQDFFARNVSDKENGREENEKNENEPVESKSGKYWSDNLQMHLK